MRSFTNDWKLWRLHLAVGAAAMTWLAAAVAHNGILVSFEVAFASLLVFLGVVGATLYRYGAASNMYRRKGVSWINPTDREDLIGLGLAAFLIVLFFGTAYLPRHLPTFWLLAGTIGILLAYPRFFSRHWATKNLVITGVCIMPLLLGWLVADRYSSVIPLVFLVFGASFFAREVVKDIADTEVDRGFRLTLPIRFGPKAAARVAGGALLIATVALIGLLSHQARRLGTEDHAWTLLTFLLPAWYFGGTTGKLLSGQYNSRDQSRILRGIAFLALMLLCFQFGAAL